MFLACPIGIRVDFPVKIIYNCSWFWSQMKSNGIKTSLGMSSTLEDKTYVGPLRVRTEGDCEWIYVEGGSSSTWWICLFLLDVAFFIPLITSHHELHSCHHHVYVEYGTGLLTGLHAFSLCPCSLFSTWHPQWCFGNVLSKGHYSTFNSPMTSQHVPNKLESNLHG